MGEKNRDTLVSCGKEREKKNSPSIYFIFLPLLFPEIEQEKGDVNEISSCLFSVLGEIKRRMSDDYPTPTSVTLRKERNSLERKKN